MDTRRNRLLVAALLVAAGIAGGFFVFAAHRSAETLLASSSDVSARLERMIATASDIASAQQAYVAPGQPDPPWFERSASLLQQFADAAAAVRPRLRSADAARVIEEVGRGLQALITIDGKARQDLQQSQNLLAADLIFSEGRDTSASLITAIRGLSGAEQSAAAARRASLEHQQWAILGIVGLLWVVGLVVLVPVPAHRAGKPPEAVTPTSADVGTFSVDLAEREARGTLVMDLAAAAEVCASLARISDAAALPGVLAQAAAVIDARGIIVWVGAGEELFPAFAYGYDDGLVGRLGPIARNARNATADAWRTGQMRTVAADVVSHGAIVTPLAGVGGCVGVFAAEVRHGREEDPSTRAVAVMIAAQLAGIVPAWPAGSTPALPADVQDSGPLAASGGA